MSMRSQKVVAVVLVALAVSVGTVPAGAVGAAKQQPRRSAAAAHTTTVVAQPAVREDRSAAITVLLVGAGAAVGVIVGVIPAVVAATLLGYLPPPRRLRRTRRASSMLVEPPLVELGSERASAPAPVVFAAAQEPSSDPPRSGQLAILAHARHQAVYDAAYAEQLDRVETLRTAIGGRRSKSPEPPPD